MMGMIAYLINSLCSVASFLLLVYVVLSVLISFKIVNIHQQFVRMVFDGLSRLFEPVLRKIRKVMPDSGQLDLSPIILFILIGFVQYIVAGTH